MAMLPEGAVARRTRRTVAIFTCASVLLAACHKHVPVNNPTEGQRFTSITLISGHVIAVKPPEVARWESGRVVVRDSGDDIIRTYTPDQIGQLHHRKTKVLATVALITGVTFLALALLVTAAGGLEPEF